MKDGLLASDPNWQVWTDWYDAWLAGAPVYPGLDAATQEDLEVAICLIPDADWQRGPAHVNAMIKAMIDAAYAKAGASPPLSPEEPEVPPQQASAIVPVWEDGRLVQSRAAPEFDVAPHILMASLDALRGDIETFVGDIERFVAMREAAGQPPQFDTTPVGYLRGLGEMIPPEPPPLDLLFRIFHAEAALAAFRPTVKAEWPELFAARFVALIEQFKRTANLSPDWRALNGSLLRPSKAAIAMLPEFAEEFFTLGETPEVAEIIDRSLFDRLRLLLRPLADFLRKERPDPLAADKEALAHDVIEGMNNIVKRLVEAALELDDGPMGKVAKRTGRQILEGLRVQLPKSGKKLGAALARIIIWSPLLGAGALFADYFGWFAPIWKLVSPFLKP